MRPSFNPFLLALLLAACRGGNPSSPAPQTTAAFTVGGSAVAGEGVTFDATPSVDGAGSALSYTWTFGDGARGGTRTVAHPYAQAGAYTVQLLVRDAAGNTSTASQTVTVAAGPAATGTAVVQGRVTLPGGTPLSGVQVTVQGIAGAVSTAADGSVTLPAVPVGVPAVLRLSRAGHLGQVVRLSLPAGVTTGYFETSLVPAGPTATLAAVENGGTVNGPDGLRVVAPPASFVDAAGAALTGAVNVSFTPIDLRTQAAAFPGEFAGIQPNGQKTPIASLGVADVTVTRAGAPVLVAPGKTVTVEIPIYAGSPTIGQSIPLWSLNEAMGTWVQEGTGTVVASPGSPTGMALRGEVAHFTPWNVDLIVTPGYVRPRCLSGPATPLTVPCWTYAVYGSPSAPGMGSPANVAPGQTGVTMAVLDGMNFKIVAHGPGGLYGESLPFTVAVGATVDVDVVLAGAAPVVNLVSVGGDGQPAIAVFDGTDWVGVTSPLDGPGGRGEAVAWNGSLWVAGGQGPGAQIATSPDGLVWTAAASATPLFTSVSGVAWNGSLWVAVGAGPGGFAVATSPDGQAWTARAAPAAGSGLAVAWNGSEWLVGGHALGGMLASPDGITWTLRPTSFGAGDVRAVAWNGAAWLATAGSSLATSSDGVVWTTQPSPVVSPRALAWNGFTWAVGGQQAVALGSGTSWTVSTLMTAEVYGLAWAGGQWAAIGEGPTGAMAMYFNGINWTTGGVPFQTRGRAIAYRKPLYPPPPP